MKKTQLVGPALLFATAPFATSQVIYATDDSVGEDNHYLDTGTGMSTSMLWTGSEAWSLADDDTAGVVYIGDGSSLFMWPYNDPNPATLVGGFNDNGRTLVPIGLGYNNGSLLAFDNDTLGQEGFYDVDVVTGNSTLFFATATIASEFGGVDIDPATNLIYCSNDGTNYADTAGLTGRGIVTVDATTMTESIIAPYPTGVTDIDGLAFDPTGIVWLLEDNPAPLHNYDLATMLYDPAPPMNAILASEIFSGGTFTTVFDPNGSGGGGGPVGTNYCVAVPNSTGAMGTMSGNGSATASDNDLTIMASSLPLNQFGIFLTSSDQAFVPGASGTSNGNLCLGGAIGRYTTAAQILSTGPTGEFSLVIDLTAVPQGNGTVPVLAGETRNFQAWTRDGVGLGSNFTDGLEILFN